MSFDYRRAESLSLLFITVTAAFLVDYYFVVACSADDLGKKWRYVHSAGGCR
jgi:hypothetical protein